MEHFNRLGCLFGSAELDESKTTGAARHLVEHEVDTDYDACAAELVLDVAFENLIRQVAHEEPAIAVHKPITYWPVSTPCRQPATRGLLSNRE